MKRMLKKVLGFLLPPASAPLWVRLLPFLVLGGLTLASLTGGAYAWEYTNSSEFCGTACHTMPPEYTSYLTSPHARVDCVECHIGRDFIATRITRKAGDLKHVFATAFKTYEFPIRAHDLRPARETCERCHFPEKFSDDSLRELKQFAPDSANTPSSLYLVLKTGGGSSRLGLGRGIHWHIENQVYFLPIDPQEQVIPYIQVVESDGATTEYIDIDSEIDLDTIDPSELKEMDCITCHNRITHLVLTPEATVDQLLERGLISLQIPEIRRKAVEVYGSLYGSVELGLNGIAGLAGYYQTYYPDFYAVNSGELEAAIAALQDAYRQSVFPEQNSSWETHPNNLGHKDSPGCFRCHDGKHLNARQEAVRLECNLCHSIPVLAGPADFVASIEISRGPEPASHLNPNWIGLHHAAFDKNCANCHTTGNPGGTDNSSFCANSACHGNVWEYAGLDAPGLREILLAQLPATPPAPTISAGGPLTYTDTIGPLFSLRCGACHGSSDGIQGLDLTSYTGVLKGGASGPAIIPGDPAGSLAIQKMSGEKPHFGQFEAEELNLLSDWIKAGAPEQ